MKPLLPFILAVCSTLPAQTIQGHITDPSGAAVGGTLVTLQPRDGSQRRTAQTDPQGDYLFENVGPARYLLIAEAPGLSASGEITAAGKAKIVRDLRLELTRVASRVSVTASSTAQSTDEISKAFDVIDSGEIARRQEFAMTEALRLVPGVRVAQLGGPGSLVRIYSRGLRARDTSLLIDGARFRDIAAPEGDATGFLSDFLLTGSDRIEVLRGSGSSLYGTHAIGGVVNMVTDAGGSPFHGEVSLDGGGLGLVRGAARLAGGAWQDRFRYSLGAAHLNVTRGVDGDDRARNSTAQGWSQFALSPRTAISGRIFTADTFAGLNITPFAAPVSALGMALPTPAVEGATFATSLNDPDSRRSARFLSGMAVLTHQFSAAASLRAQYQGLITSRDTRNGPVGPGFQPRFNQSNVFDGRTDTAQVRADVSPAPRHQISAGYEYEREDYDNVSTEANPAAAIRAQVRVNQASHALFAQDQVRLAGDRLRLSLSGRFQNFDLALPQFFGGSPRYAGIAVPNPPRALTGDAALSYFVPSSGTKLRAHVGNSYRAPALYERFGYGFFGGAFSPYGDPRVAPERSIGIDAGVDQYLASSRVRVSGSLFYTRLQQVIGFDFSGLINPGTDPYGRFGGYRNTGGGLARGVELSVNAQATRRLYFQASYTYTNSDERNSVLLGGSVRSIRISPHMFTLMATQRVWRGLDVTFDFFAASSYWWQMFAGGNRPFLFPGPKKGDLAVSYTLPVGERRKLEWFTRVENVFNRVYFEDAFRTPKAWAVAGMKLLF